MRGDPPTSIGAQVERIQPATICFPRAKIGYLTRRTTSGANSPGFLSTTAGAIIYSCVRSIELLSEGLVSSAAAADSASSRVPSDCAESLHVCEEPDWATQALAWP